MVTLGRQGRLVIPARLRNALQLRVGDRLHLHLEDSRLVLSRPQDAVAELQGLVADVPPGRCLVGELLSERRARADE